MKIMFVVGIIAGLAVVSAKAQEGCNGPVFVPGSATGSCNCSPTPPNCSGGPVTVRNDYSRCGGTGFTYCHSMNDTIGYSGMPCVGRFDLGILVTLQLAYGDCIVDHQHNDPNRVCTPPQYCQWNFCEPSTSGGSPITASVLYELGSSPCGIVKLQRFPSPSVVKLTLAFLGVQAN